MPSSDATEVTDAKDDDGTDPLAIAALVVAIVAGLLGAGALVTARRQPAVA